MDNGESSYRRFLMGDDEGLHEIICDYQLGLTLYLNIYVQNIHTAEELVRDTFAELAIKCPKFSGKSSFKTWLYSIGRNIAYKYIRKHKNTKVVPLETISDLEDENNIQENYIKSEQKKIIHKALQALSPDTDR